MDRFKPLIEYYKNVSNLLNDILLSIVLLIFSSGVHYMVRSMSNEKPVKFNILMLPLSFLIMSIYRSYRLKSISQYEFYSLLLLLIIILYFINPNLL
jgi:hypothetical protein